MEPIHQFQYLGMPPEWCGALMWVYPEHMRAHALDKGETVNFIKGALVTADRVVTVSSVRCRDSLGGVPLLARSLPPPRRAAAERLFCGAAARLALSAEAPPASSLLPPELRVRDHHA